MPATISIAVVEDQEQSRNLLVKLLRLDGYRVEAAADGDDALALIERMRPNVAIIDIGLPGRDGYQVASIIRQRLPDRTIRLIALTGYGQEADVRRALDAGFDHHLVKPLQPEALRKLLGPAPRDTQPPSD